jgi:hypothetical protein
MALWLCVCGRHVRRTDPRCPFCRAAALVCVGALGIACGARTELDGVEGERDADSAVDASDAHADSSFNDIASPPDVVEECTQSGGSCTSSSQCCFNVPCVDKRCGSIALYGSPPPPDED